MPRPVLGRVLQRVSSRLAANLGAVHVRPAVELRLMQPVVHLRVVRMALRAARMVARVVAGALAGAETAAVEVAGAADAGAAGSKCQITPTW